MKIVGSALNLIQTCSMNRDAPVAMADSRAASSSGTRQQPASADGVIASRKASAAGSPSPQRSQVQSKQKRSRSACRRAEPGSRQSTYAMVT